MIAELVAARCGGAGLTPLVRCLAQLRQGLTVDEGLIQPVDTAQVGHFGDLSPALRDHEYLAPGGTVYGVAWVWGVTSFAVWP